MNIYEGLGLKTIINASDVYTVIGGSRMDETVVNAMIDASHHFVDIVEFERKASSRIAELTHNEACYITAGAAAGVLLTAAACMTGMDVKKTETLPVTDAMKNEFLTFTIQMSESVTFLHMIETAGGRIVRVKLDSESIEQAINDRTAGVFFYPQTMDFGEESGLAEIIETAHKHDIPVIVDAAAMLPPISNFWYCTKELGADLIIFSGGKHIAGPQSTGLILGKEPLVEACRLNGGPQVKVGRPAKVGKEEIAGILTAVERFVSIDFDRLKKIQNSYLYKIEAGISDILGLKTKMQPYGTLQQDYPMLIVSLPDGVDGNELHLALRNGSPSIDIRCFFWKNISDTIFINPICMQPDEPEVIIKRLRECLVK